MITRNDVLSQACDECIKELYSFAQPSVKWEDFVKACEIYTKCYEEWDTYNRAYRNREENPEKYQKNIIAMQQYWIKHPEEKQKVLQKATNASIEWKKSHPQKVAEIMQKMREKAKEKTCKKVQCIQTGIVYESAREADRQTGLKYYNIGKVCTGKMKTTGGFHWKFYQEDK